MLKKMCGLFLGLVVLAGSACVTPTHASSAQTIVMTYVQAGGASGAREELIVLYNSSLQAADLADACLVNKSMVAFACFDAKITEGKSTNFTLPAYGYVTIASEEYVQAHTYARDYYSLIYSVTNQTSGSIVGSADTITLLEANGDQARYAARTWTTSLSSTKAWVRTKLITEPDIYAINNDTTDWSAESITEPPRSALVISETPLGDTPSDGEGGDPGNPGQGSGGGDSPTIPSPATPLFPVITEILPNPEGSDAGAEYIELYNPNPTSSVPLAGLRLRIGLDTPKWYDLPEEVIIAPQSYLVLYNNTLGFTLVNSSGNIQLFNGTVAVGDPIAYTSPKDGLSWAVIDGEWTYTEIPTPGLPNRATIEVNDEEASDVGVSTQKPCASNQYRNPETGRCKLLASTESAPVACKEGQERNPETNRCRSIASTSAVPAPCKEGQERNPETNRCRAIVKMTDAGSAVRGVQMVADNQPRWYYWLAIIGVVVLVLAYAIWEWREELKAMGARLKSLVRK